MAEDLSMVQAGLNTANTALNNINDSIQQGNAALQDLKQDSGLTKQPTDSVSATLEDLLRFDNKGKGNLGQMVKEMEKSLNKEMEKLYKSLKDGNDDFKKLQKEITKKFKDESSGKSDGAIDNKDDIKKAKNSVKTGDLIKLSAKYAMGPLLLHQDLEEIKGLLSSKGLKKPKKEKEETSGGKGLLSQMKGIQDIGPSIIAFGQAAKSLALIALLSPFAKLGMKAMSSIVISFANLSNTVKDDLDSIKELNDILINLQDASKAIVKTALILAAGSVPLLIGAVVVFAIVPILKTFAKVSAIVGKDKENIKELADTINNISEAAISLVQAAAYLTLGAVLFLTGTVGAMASQIFIKQILKTFTDISKNKKQFENFEKTITPLVNGIESLVQAAKYLTLGFPLLLMGILGAWAAAAFVNASFVIINKLENSQKSVKDFGKNAGNLFKGFLALSAAAFVAALVLPFAVIGIVGALALWGFIQVALIAARALNAGAKILPKFMLNSLMLFLGFAALSLSVFLVASIGKLNWKNILLGVVWMAAFIALGIGLGVLFAVPYVAGALASFMTGAVMLGIGFMMMTLPILAIGLVSKLINQIKPLAVLGAIGVIVLSTALLAYPLLIATPAAILMAIFGVSMLIGVASLFVVFKLLSKMENISKKIDELLGLKGPIFRIIKHVALWFIPLYPAVISAIMLAVFGVSMLIASATLFLTFKLLSIMQADMKAVLSAMLQIASIVAIMAAMTVVLLPATYGAMFLMLFGITFLIGTACLFIGLKTLSKIGQMDYKQLLLGMRTIATLAGSMAVLLPFVMLGTLASAYLNLFALAFWGATKLLDKAFTGLVNIGKANVMPGLANIKNVTKEMTKNIGWVIAGTVSAGILDIFAKKFESAATSLDEGISSLVRIGTYTSYKDGLNIIKGVAEQYSELLPFALKASMSASLMNPFITLFETQMDALSAALLKLKLLDVSDFGDVNSPDSKIYNIRKAILGLSEVLSSVGNDDDTSGDWFQQAAANFKNFFKDTLVGEAVTGLKSMLRGSVLGNIMDMLDVIKAAIDIVDQFNNDTELVTKLDASKENIKTYITKLNEIVQAANGSITNISPKNLSNLSEATLAVVVAITESQKAFKDLSFDETITNKARNAMSFFAALMGNKDDGKGRHANAVSLTALANKAKAAGIKADSFTGINSGLLGLTGITKSLYDSLARNHFDIFDEGGKCAIYADSPVKKAVAFYGKVIEDMGSLSVNESKLNKAVTGITAVNDIFKLLGATKSDEIDMESPVELVEKLAECGNSSNGWLAMERAMTAVKDMASVDGIGNILDSLSNANGSLTLSLAPDPKVEAIYELLDAWNTDGIIVKKIPELVSSDGEIKPKEI